VHHNAVSLLPPWAWACEILVHYLTDYGVNRHIRLNWELDKTSAEKNLHLGGGEFIVAK
jgi:hypothetical protein